jgi:exosortase/archaeosortase family protein
VKANRNTPASTRTSPKNCKFRRKATPPATRTVNPITTENATKNREERENTVEDSSEDTERPTPRALILYLVIAVTITLLVYFLPQPFFLAIPTAVVSAALLTWIGIPSVALVDWIFGVVFVYVLIPSSVPGFSQFFQIVRECTGIQVIAVFMGLILPLPRGTWSRKILAVIVVTILLFVANVLRVVFEIWLVFMGILPWELAHYPMSFILGVVGVFILCIVAIFLVPGFIETFEDMIYYLFPPKPEENKTVEASLAKKASTETAISIESHKAHTLY